MCSRLSLTRGGARPVEARGKVGQTQPTRTPAARVRVRRAGPAGRDQEAEYQPSAAIGAVGAMVGLVALVL